MFKRLRTILKWTLPPLLTIILVVGAWVWWTTKRAPTWWAPPDPALAPELAITGESLENSLVSEVHRIRPARDDTWTLELDEADINAWCATRLRMWIQNRNDVRKFAGDLSEVHVKITPDRILIGGRVGGNPQEQSGGRILSVSLQPTLDDQGQLLVGLSDFALGRLPIPLTSALPGLGQLAASNETVASVLDGQPVDPIFDLPDSRRVRITAIDLELGRITLTCITELER